MLTSRSKGAPLSTPIDKAAPLRLAWRPGNSAASRRFSVISHGRRMPCRARLGQQLGSMQIEPPGRRARSNAAAASRCRSCRDASSASLTRIPAITRFGRDLGERHEHEGALEQARVRQGEVVIGQGPDRHRRGGRYRWCAAPSAARARGRGRAALAVLRRAPAGRAGVSVVAIAMTALTNGGCSVTPQGGVR